MTAGWSGRSRLSPPPLASDVLARTALLESVQSRPPGTVTLLRAPAGFGKTVFAALLLRHLRARRWRCAWLSLQPEQREVGRFRHELRRALSLAGVQLQVTPRESMDDPSDPEAEAAVLDALDRTRAPCALFIDAGAQGLGADLGRCMQRLLGPVPPRARIVIATRGGSGLATSRPAADGTLHELGGEELRFPDEEVVEHLRGLTDSQHLDAMLESLAGWPVAVRLARAALQRHGGGSAAQQPLIGGTDGALGRYIDEQILDTLSAGARSLLADAAELRTDSLPLTDAARGCSLEVGALAEFAALRPLVSVGAGPDATLTVHPAIAARLRRWSTSGSSRRELHTRAAAWLIGRGDASGAVSHMVTAGEVGEAAELIDRIGPTQLVADLGIARFDEVCSLVPPQALARLPRARLAWITHLLNRNRYEEAIAELERVRAEERPTDPAARSAFLRDLQEVEMNIRFMDDRFPATAELERIVASAALMQPTDPSGVLWRQQRGELRIAQRDIEQLAGAVQRSGMRFDSSYLQAYKGLVLFGLGDLEAAAQALAEAAASDPGARSRGWLVTDVFRAELCYEAGEPEKASALLARHANHHCALEEWYDVYVARRVLAARLAVAEGAVDTAVARLLQEATYAQARKLEQRRIAMIAAAIELLHQTGRGDEAVAMAAQLPRSLAEIGEDSALPWRLVDLHVSARSRLELVSGDLAKARVILEGAIARWDRLELQRGSLRAQLLLAGVVLRQGRHPDAADLTVRCLRTAARTGHLRVLLDERLLLGTLLAHIRGAPCNDAPDPVVVDYARHLQRQLDILRLRRPSEPARLISRRELDVIVGLSRGHTNKMIAATCGIAENTVKHHVRRIYRKLKVRRRVQAVAEARRQGLLP